MAKCHPFLLRGVLFYLDDVDFSPCYLDFAIADREKRVVSAHLDVLAGKKLCAALSDNDAAGFSDLSRIQLNTTVFRIAVSAVSC
jgi:hypothetical protein